VALVRQIIFPRRGLGRRWWLPVAAGAAAAVLVLTGVPGLHSTPSATAAERPNLLLINLDDARFDAWQYLPKTTAWMASGVTFANTRAAIPSCCPSRASLFTGRYPHNDGVKLQSGGANLTGQPTLMSYLESAGYRTAMAGKFLISWPRTSPPPGFDRHTVIWGGYYDYSAAIDSASRTVSEYSTTFLAKQLRGYLHGFESADATPWFGYLAPQAPHVNGGWKSLAVPETKYAAAAVGPCAKPGEPDRSDKPPYVSWVKPDPAYDQAVCESQIRTLMTVDDEIDLTLRQLQADGELSSTIVMVTSDNGYFWGEHDWKDKFLPYEPSVRIPLKIRWDGHLTVRTDTRLASVVDILPTMLETTGSTPSAVIDGRSLFRTDNLRSNVYSEYFTDPDNGSTVPTWASLTNATRKYIETYIVDSSGRITTFKEYYNLVNDPGELVNLLKDGNLANDPSADELTWLTQRLTTVRACKGTGCP
jgi:N-acetylglucosamine-6-sulfatase